MIYFTCARLLSLLLLACSASLAISTNSLCIGNASCPQHCEHFEDLPLLVRNNTVVLFCSREILVNSSKPIVIQNLVNVTFSGNDSTLICSEFSGAGLKFVDMTGLIIRDISIIGCGAEHNSTTTSFSNFLPTVLLQTALYIYKSRNVHFDNVQISNSFGIGLVLYDVSGSVKIWNSLFHNNSHFNKNESCGGGVYVEFTLCFPGSVCNYDGENITHSSYDISNCTFSHNNASFSGPKYMKYSGNDRREDHQGLGRGGGLSIQLNGRSEANTINVNNCTFEHNIANWGGGVYIVMQDYSNNNIVHMKNLIVRENVCKDFGGGGVDLGLNGINTTNNSMHFDEVIFVKNGAVYGGGIRVYSSLRMHDPDHSQTNKILFSNCKWIQNTARFGSAVDIYPHVWEVLSNGFLPYFKFHNCEFNSNYISTDPSNIHCTSSGKGALMLTRVDIIIDGLMMFLNNSGSAVFLTSSKIIGEPNTTCIFSQNSGFEGGAIAFIGLSALFVNKNTYFKFENNSAERKGGALYEYNIDKHNFVSSRSCFIQYIGTKRSVENNNVTFIFINNSAGFNDRSSECNASGHAIFSPSLLTCIIACKNPTHSEGHINSQHQETFNCVGNFSFVDSDSQCQISTSGGRVINQTFCDHQQNIELIPGKEEMLPISLLNDFNQTIDVVYYATVTTSNGSITISHPYTHISNRKILVHGRPDSKGVLRLQKLGYRELIVEMRIVVLSCPPGYSFDKTKWICVCSDSKFKPYAIKSCDSETFTAELRRGYWLGYADSDHEYEYGDCPIGYCQNHFGNLTSRLPQRREKLDICVKQRTGRLCGRCKENSSVYYHSIHYHCRSSEFCDYGWLLYIVSELLPVTIFFVLVVVFNVSFTTGTFNGFILYAQVIDSFPINANSFIVFPNATYTVYRVFRMVYNIFNFEFFSHEYLSFCLWKGATTMDVLTFRFVTVVYVIVLIIFTVYLLNHCNILKRMKCLQQSSFKSSIIHALSSVLVIIFSQCFKICCQILALAQIHGEGNGNIRATVVFLQGDLKPFAGEHIKYATVAVVCMLIVVTPVMLLLVYPLCFKILQVLKCNDDNRIVEILLYSPYTRVRPFLDSFQSCFKDNYRVFAGLYFVYRALIVLATLIPKLSHQYKALDALVVSFIFLHAVAQPYHKRLHNVLDALLFVNLFAINLLTRINFSNSRSGGEEEMKLVQHMSNLVIVLVNIPLLCMGLYFLVKIGRRFLQVGMRYTSHTTAQNCTNSYEMANILETINLPPLRYEDIESDSDESGLGYQSFESQNNCEKQPCHDQ